MAKKLTNLTPKKTLSIEAVLPVIVAKKGNLAAVARAFGVTRQSVHGFVKSRATLRDAVAEAKEIVLDQAEEALHKAARRGEGWAVCFLLKTQGRGRGYVQRLEVDGDEQGRWKTKQQPHGAG